VEAAADFAQGAADKVWLTAARTLTSLAGVAADIRAAVGLAAANLDTQLTAIDDFIDTEVAAIKAKTDQLTFTVAGKAPREAALMGTAALLWPDQETDPFAELFDELRHAPDRRPLTLVAPTDWQGWLPALFPQHVKFKFADRHIAFWEWVWSIELDSSPRPFVGIWPRGGAKSTSAELAVGARCPRQAEIRLYVRETQEQADKSVANVAALLESKASRLLPRARDRMVSKFGASRGWRRNRLRTSGGFTVDAIGLDTAARGVKVEEQRPDLIILDDIDDKHDSAGATARKIKTITTSILPAGSSNAAISRSRT
jgi:hypothetical protein